MTNIQERALKLLGANGPDIVAFLGVLQYFDVEMLSRSLVAGGPLAEL